MMIYLSKFIHLRDEGRKCIIFFIQFSNVKMEQNVFERYVSEHIHTRT